METITPLGPAYLHVMETMAPDFTPVLREQRNGAFVLNPVTPGSRTGAEQLPLIQDRATDILYLDPCQRGREVAAAPERVVPQFVVDQCAASDAVHRKAERRPHTGCMRTFRQRGEVS
ncbi:hypothetical protein [Streptomyces sp. NPDC008125]|uniref:hypothetical protein n=1 Tax=Streptomyces sp. NPDC008125 TaxID=3364811 RepID=UPI0036F086CC